MNQTTERNYQVEKFSRGRLGRSAPRFRRPFWLPASSYYVLSIAAAITFFFLVWGILHEGNEEVPWIAAGIGASFVLAGAVVLREVFLRKAQERYLVAVKRLDYNLSNIPPHVRPVRNSNKLSVEQNATIISRIKKKSEAARALVNISGNHFEVFEMCGEYLAVNERQMETVGIGSPRIAALRRGREVVREIHHYHLIKWAEIESRSLSQKAKNYVTISKKLNAAQDAADVLETALRFYPEERQLIESEAALKEFIASIRISHWIEQAERAAFKGNQKRALSLYRDALFYLAREDVKSVDKEKIAEQINSEIELLRGHREDIQLKQLKDD